MSCSKDVVPVKDIPESLCRGLEVLFVDVDDTLTQGGVLPARSYSDLWRLSENGISVVPVTGRSAGWCDHIARVWPVKAVVGENGAFYYAYKREEEKLIRRYTLSHVDRAANNEKLERIKTRVLTEIPDAAIAADQDFRFFDLAIDYAEDVGPLDKDSVADICRIVGEEGANFKVSSIHVNCWYGDYDKMSGIRLFLSDNLDGELDDFQEKLLFIGDSPNDEPIFKAFENSVAVANMRKFLDDLVYTPRYMTSAEAADGFCETVEVILSKRKN
jgi:hypothetical protein